MKLVSGKMTKPAATAVSSGAMQRSVKSQHRVLAHLKRFYWLYLFLIPGFVYIYLFKLRPIYGLQIAFKDYSVVKGIWESPWTDYHGFGHFVDLFRSIKFTDVFVNSITLSLLRLLFSFPVPILLALALNEINSAHYKKVAQTVMYLPHFIGWVVVYTILQGFLAQADGVVNQIIVSLGGKKIPFLASEEWFRPILILSEIWKEAGWGTVVYLAALAGIDPSIQEAAMIDGASRWQRIRFIFLPCILSTVTVMLIMQMGSILSNGLEQMLLFQNSMNIDVSEVLETYSYTVGLKQGRYAFGAAIGLFQSAVGCIMVFVSNYISKKTGGGGLW
jgi:putative aldouronate transport system permease protein